MVQCQTFDQGDILNLGQFHLSHIACVFWKRHYKQLVLVSVSGEVKKIPCREMEKTCHGLANFTEGKLK